ncbi:MAG: bifunctional phosphoribosyl-AMP cyclohydrolase/phosphoribosyl-ATP diphosphatase HisIE [Bacteroidetes bacterium]|nr:bifunctional phosphoribosyl-AMP cyclohydrolase/phosphoribosyl-ATP diphosphatase HisIE [Bacteroidota bacterium]MDA1175819.1 bifunctional phosphoribosyl-AMP cyclohydrolase/phosphoribosyl-ATP diphosphatase HisIE [Bacteroidota bacterium]
MEIKFNTQGLVPVIVQDEYTKTVLMLGYMNQEAVSKTLETKRVTFYSRSKQRLWTKGEESGHFLEFISMKSDCDHDALLVKALPKGPTCHKGTDNCWGEENTTNLSFLNFLEVLIDQRKNENKSDDSYVAGLFEKGINKIAQKVGEEAVEVVIEAKDTNDDLFLAESADLLFHYMILLKAKGFQLNDVVNVLKSRH